MALYHRHHDSYIVLFTLELYCSDIFVLCGGTEYVMGLLVKIKINH